jgi:deazaflavin-dependent oxidoreductase (nitroreductase family)
MAHSHIRAFNKHIFNRLIRTFAGTSRTPFAVIRHVGRRSGAAYETPIIVEPMGDAFVIALTYGPGVDWYRNVMAAGHSTLLWHGRAYLLEKPEPIEAATGLSAFPQPLRLILRLVGQKDFVRLRSQGVVPAG